MSLYSIDTQGGLEAHLSQEWLMTNGIGAFASSTVVGCNTRRYHGLLCAATLPPLGRMMLLNRVGEILHLDGDEQTLEFSVNQFDDRFHPRGDQYLRRFEINDVVRWEYDVAGVRVVKELLMAWKRNVVGLRYTLDPGGSRRTRLQLLPFVSMRDFHSVQRGQSDRYRVRASGRRLSIETDEASLHVVADAGAFIQQPDWWFDHTYALETERGLDDHEELFTPGRFVLEAQGPGNITLWAASEAHEGFDWNELRRERFGATEIEAASPARHRLMRAANDFVVRRKSPQGKEGTSILAGYPWFADWGRDTMISLPGILLTTGRFEQARQVLSVFAGYVSEGMIPNLFDDYSNEPHYNTVDASLWFIHSAHEYLRRSKDQATFDKTLLPACKAIVQGYRAGTRYHIKMDPDDGLITQGDANTQLTWMDAKCGGVAFTPRQGKAVEINALWYNALMLMREDGLAKKVAANFQRVFWISPFRGLCDVVDGARRDTSLRPNQIFAVSLPHNPLTRDQQHAVVEVVRRELLTPFGLRTLPTSDPCYHGKYSGPQQKRDEAYHNGTVWAWLIGAFLDAYLKVNDRSIESREQAKRWLRPLIDHLEQACIGQISEIFEGDPPHRPVGCPAQAWSVAEVLRLAVELGI